MPGEPPEDEGVGDQGLGHAHGARLEHGPGEGSVGRERAQEVVHGDGEVGRTRRTHLAGNAVFLPVRVVAEGVV